MANGNLSACLKITLAHEGGWADHPKDPGGATMKGVTLATYRRYRPGASKADLRAISDDDLVRVYRDGFWNKVSGELLPFGVDLVTFDAAVNSGPGRAARWLQAAVGAKQDGEIGPATLRGISDPKSAIQRMCAKRLGFVQGLKTWGTFGRGWSRRIADIEARAVAMWLAHSGGIVSDALNKEAARADRKASGQKSSADGALATGAAGGPIGIALTGGTNWWVIGALAVALLVVAAGLIIKAKQNEVRAAAYRRVALGQ